MPTHYSGSPAEIDALNTYIRLHRAVSSLDARLMRRAVLEGLTPTQFGVLEALLHLGDLCQGQLGAKLLTSGGNLTLVVDHLEARGLVERRREPEDRRKVTVRLTPTGRALIERIMPEQVRAISAELDMLTPEEHILLGSLLKKIGKPAEQS